eukprot:gene29560-29547_t
MVEEATREVEGRRLHNFYHHWKGTVIVVVASVLWLLFGTAFYVHSSGLRLDQAFYFCVQSGLSIGYGATNVTCATAPADPYGGDACRWYTVFHVLVGSVIISVALGLWLSDAVNKQSFEQTLKSIREHRDDKKGVRSRSILFRASHSVTKYPLWYAVLFSLVVLLLLASLFGYYDQGFTAAE